MSVASDASFANEHRKHFRCSRQLIRADGFNKSRLHTERIERDETVRDTEACRVASSPIGQGWRKASQVKLCAGGASRRPAQIFTCIISSPALPGGLKIEICASSSNFEV